MNHKLKPEFCCFGITDHCFLRCKMCEKWKPDPNTDHIPKPSFEQWRDAITSLRTIVDDGFLINFGGGEALTYPGLLELVRHAADRGFRTNIASNAYLIDEAMAKRIGASGLASINISLDSMVEATHDYLRGVKGVYRRAVDAVGLLDKHAPRDMEIIICCAIYDINKDEVAAVAEWVNSHPRIKWIYFMAAMQPNNTAQDRQWYRNQYSSLWPKDPARISDVVRGLIAMKERGYKINNQTCQLEAFIKYFNYPDRFVKTTSCNLDRALHVSSIGEIFVCYDWECVGNIKTDPLGPAWYSPKADLAREHIRACTKNCHHLINCFFEGDYPFRLKEDVA